MLKARERTSRGIRIVGWVTGVHLLAVAVGCREGATLHPLTGNFSRPGPPATTVSTDPSDEVPLGKPVMAALRDRDRSASLGVLDEPLALQFGSIAGAARDPSGTVFVLDAQASELRVFTNRTDASKFALDTLRVLGGAGLGPGEFQSPRALALGASGTVAVFESMGRVHLFSSRESGVEHDGTVQIRIDIDDACILGSELVIAGRDLERAGAIHVFTLQGEWLRSFGDFYDTGNHRVSAVLHRSKVACLEASRQIVVAPVFLPELRKYDAGGRLLWWSALEDLSPVYLAEMPNGAIATGTPENGYHGTVAVQADEDLNAVILQVAFVTRERRRMGEAPEILTYVFELDEGRGALVEGDIDTVRDLYPDGALLSARLPFPTLRVVSWNEDGRREVGGAP